MFGEVICKIITSAVPMYYKLDLIHSVNHQGKRMSIAVERLCLMTSFNKYRSGTT
jgi:hypothetical protein